MSSNTTGAAAREAYLQDLAALAATQDLSQDLRGYTKTMVIVFTVLAVLFVALRFLARYRQGLQPGWDDWIILSALLLLGGSDAISFVMINNGLGLHSGALTLEKLQAVFKLSIPAQVLYIVGVSVYKLSLLCLYVRIFPVRGVRIGRNVLGGICAAWVVGCLISVLLQCIPLRKVWEPWTEGTCINLFLTQLVVSIPNIITDIAILALPIPHVWRLQTNLTQRILLCAIFLLGSFVVFTSIYRFHVFLSFDVTDIPYSTAEAGAWSTVELSSGIISACLPTLGPLLRIFSRSVMPSTGRGSKGTSYLARTKQPGLVTIGSNKDRWSKLNNGSRDNAECDAELELGLVPRHLTCDLSVKIDSAGRDCEQEGNRSHDSDIYKASVSTNNDLPPTAIRTEHTIEWSEERVRLKQGKEI